MIAQMLHRSGVWLGEPQDLIAPASDNPEGFWEHPKIVAINDRLLQTMGGAWDVVPPMHAAGASEADLLAEARGVISELSACPVWAFKDPRASVLLPFWLGLLPELKVIICLRNPLEVAQSLYNRNQSSLLFGMRLWEGYNRRLLNTTEAGSRLVVHYELVLANPREELMRMLDWIGLAAEAAGLDAACATVAPRLRHHYTDFATMRAKGAAPDVLELYACLLKECGPRIAALLSPGPAAPADAEGASSGEHGSALGAETCHPAGSVISPGLAASADAAGTTAAGLAPLTSVLPAATASPQASSGVAYLYRQVQIVVQKEGIAGVIRAARRRRAAARLLRFTPPPPSSERPTVSIIIPVYNNLKFTRACLESIFRHSGNTSVEIIVVDNGSVDDTPAYLLNQARRNPQVRPVRSPTNLGFAGGVNLGVTRARGEYILVANNDLIMTAHWLEPLLEMLRGDDTLGVVSPTTNYVGEGPQKLEALAGVTVEQAEAAAGKLRDMKLPMVAVSHRLVFFCVLIPRRVWDVLGGLLGDYGPGNYEDDDFCIHARFAGYRLAISRQSFVFHHGSETFKASGIDHTGLMVRNGNIFAGRLARLATKPAVIPWRGHPSTRPRISIIVRTQNRPAELRNALQSLANQLFNDFEVVLVNDGGPDVLALLGEFPMLRINYLRHDRPMGRTAALNAGVRAAVSEWIGYLDDDDIVYPNHLDVFAAAIDADPAASVFYGGSVKAIVLADQSGLQVLLRRPDPPYEFSRARMLVQNSLPIQSYIHRKSCFDEVGGFDESLDLLEDWDFLIRLSQRHSFVRSTQVSSEYRFYVAGTSTNSTGQREEVKQAMIAAYKRYPTDDPGINAGREEVVTALNAQMESVRAIAASNAPEKEKAFRILQLSFSLGDCPLDNEAGLRMLQT